MTIYAVGDIQGCFDELQGLLDKIRFDPRRDQLWCAGDLVNRGPDSLKTLRFLKRINAITVLGNHDLHLLALAAGVRQANRSDTLDKILRAPDREELLNWLIRQPLLHHEHGHTMVHAGIPPQWSIKKAGKYAREVEAVLRSPACTDFLKHMYGNLPDVWSDDLTGMTRLRVITNYLTRMRYCTRDGVLDLESKGPSPNLGERKVSAWFSHPGRKAAGASVRISFTGKFPVAGSAFTPTHSTLAANSLPGRPGVLTLACAAA